MPLSLLRKAKELLGITSDDPEAASNDNDAKNNSDAQLRLAAPSSVPAIPEPPRPLGRATGTPDPFPVDALGPVLAPGARAIADIVQAPLAMTSNAVLATAALTVQPHADVVLPHRQSRPIGNLFVTIAQSGDRKSAVDALATEPARRYQKKLADQYRIDMKRYRAERARAEREGHEEPEQPLSPVVLTEDPNPEGLYRLFRDGRPSLGLYSDEGARFLGGYAMTDDQKLKTAAMLSDLWDGKPVTRVRGGKPPSILFGRRFSGHLMVQPGVAALLLKDSQMRDQGLLSRILVTAPQTLMGSRKYRDPSPNRRRQVSNYTDHLLSLLEQPLPLAAGSRNELEPRPLEISGPAKRSWVTFHDEVEADLRPGGRFEPIRGLAAKLAEHAARIAASLALVEDLEVQEVGLHHMEGAICLARHYAREALRLQSASEEDADLALAKLLGDWLLKNWQGRTISLVDAYQRGPKRIRDARVAARAMQVLEEHLWVTRIPGIHVVNGERRKDVWYVRPQAP